MDHLSPHEETRVRELREAAGAEAPYLPPYSPDPNLIEQALSKLEQTLRATRQRTTEMPGDATGSLLERFEPAECARRPTNAGRAIDS